MFYKWIFINTHNSEVITLFVFYRFLIFFNICFVLKFLIGDVADMLQKHPILPRSEIFVVSKKSHFNVIYSQLYRTKLAEPLISKTWGQYNFNNTEASFIKNQYENRRDLKGISLRAGAVLNSPKSLHLYITYGF